MQIVYDEPPLDGDAAIEVDDANRRAPGNPIDVDLDADDPRASVVTVRHDDT